MRVIKKHTFSWIDILIHPYVLAVPLAVLFILMLPDIFDRYELKLVRSGISDKSNSTEKYHDLNGDGFSERLVLYNNTLGQPALKILSNQDHIMDQWNFRGRFPDRQQVYSCGDMNGDGISEIYVFTISSDSLLMHCIAPFTEKIKPFGNKFVTRLERRKDTIQFFLGRSEFRDMNADGYNDFIFQAKSGFSLQPRALMIYDQKQDTILRTARLGANIGQFTILDTDNDHLPEIYMSCNTLGNIHDSLMIPYGDYSAYFMGFDHRLKPLFEPIQYPAFPSYTNHITTEVRGDTYFLLFFRNRSGKGLESAICLVDRNGRMIKRNAFNHDDPNAVRFHSIGSLPDAGGREVPALFGKTHIALLDEDMHIEEVIETPMANNILYRYDLSGDGQAELIFRGTKENMVIMQNKVRYPVFVETHYDAFSNNPFCVSVKENGTGLPELFIKSDNKAYWYTFRSNAFYYLQYPAWLLIYLWVLFAIYMIRSLYRTQAESRIEMENHLNALQLKTLKSQMDPHFMFNALNSISLSILNKQPNVAYKNMVKYSQLLRLLFTKADQLSITLKEELEFVEQYLELEQFRFEDRLSFSILIQPDVDQRISIPRMFIQLFVENAIKHGLAPKRDMGHISITGMNEAGRIQLVVEDNGIGRQAAGKKAAGSGMGLKIINEMISLFHKVSGKKIQYHFEDISDKKGTASGTRVRIFFPV